MIKGVIFDFDGTLFDSMEIWNHIASDYLLTKGIEDYNITKVVANMSMNVALIYIKNQYHINDGLSIMNKDVQKLLYHYYANEVKPKNGVIHFLEYLSLQKVRMFILSASHRKLIEAALNHYHIKDYFEGIMCCDELGLDKKDAHIFISVLKNIELSKEELLIVEDAYHAIETAKSIGLKVIGIYDQSEKQDIKSLVDFYIQDYQELEDYINEKGINNSWY